ncbi:hypothetical protein [Streptomyces prunicolor]|uniref:hypothetical protein n=1 Tax=Streptomyces prunicolor TaxID=67348 RepID=UPI0003698E86|nr:hypothetical protein [Streptomyces prunicolor]
MNKLIGVAAVLVLVGSLVAVGCDRPADDDCDDAIGVVQQDQGGALAVELVAAPAGSGRGGSKSGGSKSSGSKAKKNPRADLKKPDRKAAPKPTGKVHGSRGHHGHDDDWLECDD